MRTRFSGLLAIGTSLALSAQLFSLGGAVLVCSYTGRVLEKCCCPEPEQHEHAAIDSDCCCEIRSGTDIKLAAARDELSATPKRLPLIISALDAETSVMAIALSWMSLPESTAPPRSRPTFLINRSLLI